MGTADTPESLTGRVNATFRRRLPLKLVNVLSCDTFGFVSRRDNVHVVFESLRTFDSEMPTDRFSRAPLMLNKIVHQVRVLFTDLVQRLTCSFQSHEAFLYFLNGRKLDRNSGRGRG